MSAAKLLGILRNIKYTIHRRTLNQIYIPFLRPRLEYASSFWDNCYQLEKSKLEKIQLETARIVTGTTGSVTLNNLYCVTRWLTLSDRRLYLKLVLMYKIKNCMVPNYLLVLSRTDDNTAHDFMTAARRTALYENSFIPSAVDCWNNLPEHLRNSPSISCFKHILLKTKFPTREAPLHYLHGSRRLSVIHARLRNNCSDLKHDLFNNYVSASDKCQVCNEIVNAEHSYFKCRRYHNYRIDLFTTTRIRHPLNVKLLRFGDSVVEVVYHYINATKRFENN